MNLDEFSFFNQQLAAMLRQGVPLESALGRLCAEMRAGRLREELGKFHADLARGVPLAEAVAARKLPAFYGQMLQIAARTNDLPGVLTLVADYYAQKNLIATKLKGLMVYPAIVLVTSLAVSAWLSVVMMRLSREIFEFDIFERMSFDGTLHSPANIKMAVWFAPSVLAVLVGLWLLTLVLPSWRGWLRWRLPAFREASLARIASALHLLVRGGCPLPDALRLVATMEPTMPVGHTLTRWADRLASGRSLTEATADDRLFPPLFLWLVTSAGEDLPAGLQRAAELYQARSTRRAEAMLQAALPVAIIGIGFLILSQLYPIVLVLRLVSGTRMM